MIVNYIFILFLIFLVLFLYLKPVKAIFLFIIIVILFEYYIYKKCTYYIDYNKYNKQYIYDYFRHGDIIICKCFPYTYKIFDIQNYMNYNLCHIMIIIEENNEKYIVEALPKKYTIYEDYIFKKIENIDYILDKNWNMFKIPLMEYLNKPSIDFMTNDIKKTVFKVYRNPNELQIDININTEYLDIPIIDKKIYYCTKFIGDILSENNIIKKSNKLIPYRPDDLIYLINNAGFNYNNTLIYDRDANDKYIDKNIINKDTETNNYNIYLILFCLLLYIFFNKDRYISVILFILIFLIIKFI